MPPTIKVRVKPKGGIYPNRDGRTIDQNWQPTPQPKHQKGLIHKIMEIVSNDIKHPSGIFQREKRVVMPESKESWKDWEGQI